MDKLPFLSLDDDFLLNSLELIILIGVVSLNNRKKPTLNNGKIQVFLYLIKNPNILNRVLRYLNKNEVKLRDNELNSIRSISVNIDGLYKPYQVKEILQYAVCLDLIHVSNIESETVYQLSPNGKNIFSSLNSDYFIRLKELSKYITPLRSKSLNQINSLIGNELKSHG